MSSKTEQMRHTLTLLAPFACLVVLNVIYRFPVMLNAAGVHSDAAIVGLQARHILQGEFDRLLWGTAYQGSLDAFVIALCFAIGGRTPQMLMLAPFLGHLLLTFFVWHTLARRFDRWTAALLCLPIVFTPHAVNTVVMYAPRQYCITFLFAGIWLLDSAAERERPSVWFAAGTLVATLSLYLDLYALQMFVPVMAFALLCCVDPPLKWRTIGTRVFGAGLGLIVGLYSVQWLRGPEPAEGNTTTRLLFTSEHMLENWKLAMESCLTWALSAISFAPNKGLEGDVWLPAPWFGDVQRVIAASFVLLLASAIPLVFLRRVEWTTKRLGLLSSGACIASVFGFLVSTMPLDRYGTRYLAPLIWMAPFALAPLARLIARRKMALVLAPYLVLATISGWVSYGDYVDGPWPVHDAKGLVPQTRKLRSYLSQNSIRYAAADFWLCYRLAFLFRERPIIVPVYGHDRHPPYTEGFHHEPKVANIFHPSSEAKPEPILASLRKRGGQLTVNQIDDYTVIIHERATVPMYSIF